MKSVQRKGAIIVGAILTMALTCVFGCAPHPVASTGAETGKSAAAVESDQGESTAQVADWSMESDCGVCHEEVQASFEGDSGVAQAHAANSCDTCHTNIDELGAIHKETTKTKPGVIKRLETAVSNDTCLSCHGSFEELAEKTKDCTVLTDSVGTTVNPHAIPENGEHDVEPACTSCHGMHQDVDPQQYCGGCHHAGTYTCYTCHD